MGWFHCVHCIYIPMYLRTFMAKGVREVLCEGRKQLCCDVHAESMDPILNYSYIYMCVFGAWDVFNLGLFCI